QVSAGSGVPVWTYSDYWGTNVSVFDITEPHRDLVIRAQSTVETDQAPADPGWTPLPWAELRARADADRLLEFLMPTALTTVTPAVAGPVIADVRGADPVETAAEIASRVRARVSYMPGATGVRTNAQEAWDQGQGVCQDLAHVTVALLRAAGLPARYVSGYLHPDPEAEPRQTAVGESHAWVEYWAGEWQACDPTSGAPVRERHVAVARGRDYADVPPLKGIYHGVPVSAQAVRVEVTRLA
ncbi:MAG TPA: transglutaminase family protein, partial [Streptosporangiaceae bacterium]